MNKWQLLIYNGNYYQKLSCQAYTKSEARSEFKKQLGIGKKCRLKIGSYIVHDPRSG